MPSRRLCRRARRRKKPTEDLEAGALTTELTLRSIGYALALACALCTAGSVAASMLFANTVSPIPITSAMTVAVATLFPRQIGRLAKAGTSMGVLFMQLFFAATGGQGRIRTVLASAPGLFRFCVVQLAVHLAVQLGVGRLCRLPLPSLLLASNANVGGPTTASAMAAAKGWNSQILPALLTGVLGYSVATLVSIPLGSWLLVNIAR
mmetsp:Transcript_93777/g.268405  ORF Transcript_93777/g.268405 Transcript_93777/m.268405 type:complete len:207 (-) Transcript_93777:696-1316(-)